jgi:transcription elongation factor Elf1
MPAKTPHGNYTKTTGASAVPEPEPPFCPGCGTDRSLHFTEYDPARILPDGQEQAANATYTCKQCGHTRTHQVPAAWSPPDWDWFA